MSVRYRVEHGSHLLTQWPMQMWQTYDPCTCDLHSKVGNAKCNANDMKKFWLKQCHRFLHSYKDTEMDYAHSFWQVKLWTPHNSKQLQLEVVIFNMPCLLFRSLVRCGWRIQYSFFTPMKIQCMFHLHMSQT